MVNAFDMFETITRKAYIFTARSSSDVVDLHPFDRHNIHESLPVNVRRLFDDGHYSYATLEAFKYIDKEVSRLSDKSETGYKLMMAVFNEQSPLIKLNNLLSMSRP